MKLKNKKTGEIVEATDFNIISDYNSLAELNEEWEDAPEEPKEYYWYIDDLGIVSIDRVQSSTIAMRKNFGNCFSSRKEAEKAVEKLRTWKRLKEKGFRFDSWKNDKEKYLGDFVIYAHIKDLTDIVDDLDLLFGGEE